MSPKSEFAHTPMQELHSGDERVGASPMPNVLLAEDNPADVYLIREALHEHGVHCTLRVASDGREVLGIISGESASTDDDELRLIILDLNLPRHDGIEILERLRESARLAHV